MPWYVLYTKPRSEKKTAKILEDRGITVYCPLVNSVKQWSDRKKAVAEPLFRSYIFVHLSNYRTEQTPVLEVPGAVRFLWWLGAPGIVRDDEIERIQDFLKRYEKANITTDLKKGQNVTIKDGPFSDHSGKIIHVKGRRVSLHISSLGWNVVAELPADILNIDPS